MITITLKTDEFMHDIYALVKAFYPGIDIRVEYDEDGCDAVITGNTLQIEQQFFMAGMQEQSRKEKKDQLKRLLYKRLCEESGRSLPWGTLTGIRPVKIAMTMLEEGNKPEDIRDYMQDYYLVSEEKAELAAEIAVREHGILETLDYENGYSLYIGIPFCPTTCLYCSFTSYPASRWQNEMDAYLDAVEEDLTYIAEACSEWKLNTIYVGGGTPTTLSAGQLERLLKALHTLFSLDDLQELTVEAGRPDSVAREKLQVLKDNGVTRISINPQTMKQETLALIGRKHTVEQVTEAFTLAREIGFDNINMDLIIGLPGETYEDVKATLEAVCDLHPDSLTIHSLAVKRAAALKLRMDEMQNYKMQNTGDIMKLTAEYAAKMDMVPYYLYRQKNMAGNFENVGYAKVDKAGIYNILIMEEKQTILAAGAGATSKFVWQDDNRIERCENVKDVKQYMERIEEMIMRKRRRLDDYKSTQRSSGLVR